MKKIILPGLIAGLAMLIVGMLVGQAFNFVFPSLATEYNNPSIIRPWTDPIMSLFFAVPFILGIILACFWDKTKKLFKQKEYWKNGACFGIKYWVITIPGMVMSYASFPFSLLIVFSWSMSILVQGIVGGIIIARMNK